MSDIANAIRFIEAQITNTDARSVIVDEGCPDESSLLGTRDSFLRLAKALLQTISDIDEGKVARDEGRPDIDWDGVWLDQQSGGYFDDRIKRVMYNLPTNSAWIVGCVVFSEHADLMADLQKLVDWPLTNDPQFDK